jgi:ABC-2 type transport system ATP-binding protein
MTSALRIRDLKKTYKNGFQALKGISLEVEAGDFFALLGPNGAGKSTAIGIITSLVNKTSGKVSVFGEDIDTNFAAAKDHIGLVPQEFNFNVFEPVIEVVVNQGGYYGLDTELARERAELYLKQLGLWDKHKDSARTLSGGMKRRLMIARALVHEPDLLILDEPTAGVDIEIRHSMWDFLKKINKQGTTIILTTHYLEEAENLCRNIAIIDQGSIVANTSMKSLLNKLQTETYVLTLMRPIEHDLANFDYVTRKIDAMTVEVEVSQDQSINSLFAELTANGIDVSSIKSKSNRLEQLFMHIVKSNGQ